MKVNVKIDVSDEDRELISDFIDGKSSKRMATRKDICLFLTGCLDRAIAEGWHELPSVDTLREAGFDDSYVRGWIQVGDRICEK